MRPSVRRSLTTVAASMFAIATVAGALAQAMNPPGPPGPPPPPPPPWMQHWEAYREAMLDAKLAGLKAGLRLTPDQEKLWGPFESAIRDVAKMRMAHMQDMMERMARMRQMGEMGMGMGMEEGEAMSPVERLERMASHLTQAGAALQKVADAAKPLYASLDEEQRRMFGFLAREMMMMGHGPGGMGPWSHGGMGPLGHHRPSLEDEGEWDHE